MDFIDEVRTRSGRFRKRLEHLKNTDATEEATKTSFVLPFIQMLGYDIFDPSEVIPEFTADIGTKKGEKVDYALMKDNYPVVLIECKKIETSLSSDAVSQLLRYFGVTESSVGILTDGIRYRFFSDLDQSNVMDPRPFFEFNMLDFTEVQVRELKRFTKDEFDKSQIVDAARELRYTAEIKRLLARELAKPSDKFLNFVIRQVYDGRITASVRKMFRGLVYPAFNQFVSDKIQDRLASALKQEGSTREDSRDTEIDEDPKDEFTDSEMDGFITIKAMLGGLVDTKCLDLRKTKHYSSIALCRSPEKDDYGMVLFRLWARRQDYLRLEVAGIEDIRVDAIEEFFEHTDRIRELVKEKCQITDTTVVKHDEVAGS